MTVQEQAWYSHDMGSIRSVLLTCIGANFGPEPEKKIDEIRESRYRTGKAVCQRLKVAETDTVADIGSGCGFVTRAACERAAKVHCFDMSEEFLRFASDELSGFPNTSFHLIDYGKFPVEAGSLDKIFSTAVFIHFLYYDFLFYLTEVNRVLKPDGLFYVEIVDADVLDLAAMRAMTAHVRNYRANLKNMRSARLMHPCSLTAFRNLADQLGFEEVEVSHAADIAQIVVRKVADAELPPWFRDIL